MSLLSLLARAQNLEIVSTKVVDSLLGGQYRSVFKGPGLEFNQVRAYSDGDDPRSIDWNVSSRLNGVYVKTWHEERELNIFLIMDVSASTHSGAGNQRIREQAELVYALFAFAAANNNDRVGTCLFSDKVEFWSSPARGRANTLHLLRTVSNHRAQGQGSDLALALETTLQSLSRRGVVVIISDFKTAGYKKELSLMAKKHDVIAIRLVPSEDVDFPDAGMFWMEDPESGKVTPAFSGSVQFRHSYREYWSMDRKAWFQECRRSGVAAMELSSTDDPVQKLHQFFARRRRRRRV